MGLLGQEKLIQYIDNHDLSTFPRTVMLEGKEGSGRHTLCDYIGDRYGLQVEDISDSLTYEKIEEINLRVQPYLYIIDCTKLTVKNENAILKFLEEPLKNAFIVLLTENRYSQIATIRNRCYLMCMAKYSRDQLETFITDRENTSVILTICETPGDVIKMQSHPIKDMLDLCIKIFDKIGVASFANTLTLSNNIAYKNEKDKYDFKIFFKALLYIANCRAVHNEQNCVMEYLLTSDYYNRSLVRHVDKRYLFESYLIQLKKMRGVLN